MYVVPVYTDYAALSGLRRFILGTMVLYVSVIHAYKIQWTVNNLSQYSEYWSTSTRLESTLTNYCTCTYHVQLGNLALPCRDAMLSAPGGRVNVTRNCKQLQSKVAVCVVWLHHAALSTSTEVHNVVQFQRAMSYPWLDAPTSLAGQETCRSSKHMFLQTRGITK